MKLYYAPGACSLAPHIVAHEAGLPIELERVHLHVKQTDSGEDYLAINPKGSVPALKLDNGEVLTEAAVLLQYLAAQAPETGLAPSQGMAHWHFLEALNFIATELHKGFGPLWNKALPAEAREAGVANLARKFAYLDRLLATQAYLAGDSFTAADAYGYTILRWTGAHSIDMSPWPNVVAFMQRIAERPAAQAALRHEGLI
jgi:glutathione S-transferase